MPPEPVGGAEEKRVLAVAHECYAEMGKLSNRAYVAWTEKYPDRRLPSESYLRTVLGGPRRSWIVVKQRVTGGPAPDISTATRVAALGPFFEREDLDPAIHAFAGENDGPLLLREFVAWCKREIAKPRSRFARLPESADPVRRVYTSWKAALESNELGHRRQRARRREFTDLDRRYAIAAIRNCALRLSVGWFGPTQYTEWRRITVTHIKAGGGRPRIPDVQRIREMFGGWELALLEAGVIDAEEAAEHAGRGRDCEDLILYETLADAMNEYGEEISVPQFNRYRLERLITSADEGRPARVPSEGTIRARLGGGHWEAARQAVLIWLSVRTDEAAA